MTEELLTENKSRFVLFPIKYSEIFKMYQTAVSSFWVVNEIDLSKDDDDWTKKMTENERFFVKHILAFFAASDGIVGENLAMRFYTDVKVPEARAFYAVQLCMETIHSEMYSLMLDTYIKDSVEKDRLFNAIDTIPCIKQKAEWAMKYIDNKDASFPVRLVAFAIVEGVFFSGAFASIFWLREKNLMSGLTKSNDLIARDEGLHVEFAVLLYSMLQEKLTQEKVYEIMHEAVKIEKEFIIESIPCSLLGMNSELMNQYIEFVADRLLAQLGYDKMFGTPNCFPFMDRSSLENKTNFFEARALEYSKANTGKTDVFKFTLDEEF